ncbi:MAG: phosphatase PAP2 family protein [Bdellovibrionales bacterium]|nr:phosphatase PAP2 family protein [Bdellovibrionales bacterium]
MNLLRYVIVGVMTFSSLSPAYSWDVNNFKEEAFSPFTTSARNVFYVGAGLTLTVLIFEDSIVDPTQKEFTNDKPLGSFSKFGDLAGQMVPNALYAIGQILAGSAGDKYAYDRAMGMIKASAYSSGMTTILKYSVREPRPGKSTDRNSFPSGHSTTAFAFGGYIYEEHGWQWGVPALALASFVGASRINDNRHYLHDVLAGTTIGLMYGIGISKIDKMNRSERTSAPTLTIIPLFDSTTRGLALLKEF